MTEYLKYYLSPLTQLLAIWGLYAGGNLVWIGVAWLPLLGLIDSVLPDDLGARKMRSKGWAYVPTFLTTGRQRRIFKRAYIEKILSERRKDEGLLRRMKQLS